MTRTARRRWSRELGHEIDGIAFAASGPVLVHGYEPPAGGRWIDSAIPGKLTALDRSSGEILWTSPCEVGYGRGFGAGFGARQDAVVLGPSTQGQGHRVVRMSLASGELVAAGDLSTFDEALVFPDLCAIASARRLWAIDTESLTERWSAAHEGERFHHVARAGGSLFAVFSVDASKRRGVLAMDAATGALRGVVVPPKQGEIHDLAVGEGALAAIVDDLSAALPKELVLDFLRQHPPREGMRGRTPGLIALDPAGFEGDAPLWFEPLALQDEDELATTAVAADAGKLYVVRGALIEVRDALTGRKLDNWAVPGLDERVGFSVSQGAGLLAEETRVSIFELPA
jgi:hypothetical protein